MTSVLESLTDKDQQIILAVPTAAVDRVVHADGVVPLSPSSVSTVLAAGTWVLRGPSESNLAMLQVIPYIIVTLDPSHRHVLAYRRPAGGGESRLTARSSVGLGGHVELEDSRGAGSRLGTSLATVRCAALRELAEELPGLATDPGRLLTLGLIVGHRLRDAGAVERVHLGVLMHYDACGQAFSAGPELEDAASVDRDDLPDLARPEHWTRCVLRALADGRLDL